VGLEQARHAVELGLAQVVQAAEVVLEHGDLGEAVGRGLEVLQVLDDLGLEPPLLKVDQSALHLVRVAVLDVHQIAQIQSCISQK